jgi:hypothetical protein
MSQKKRELGERERGRLFLAASVGEITVTEACRKLGISRQRFYELEDRAVRAFLEALEPKAAGRPRKKKDSKAKEKGRIEELEKENQRLWLYIKALRGLAGIEERGKKGGRRKKGSFDRSEETDR